MMLFIGVKGRGALVKKRVVAEEMVDLLFMPVCYESLENSSPIMVSAVKVPLGLCYCYFENYFIF